MAIGPIFGHESIAQDLVAKLFCQCNSAAMFVDNLIINFHSRVYYCKHIFLFLKFNEFENLQNGKSQNCELQKFFDFGGHHRSVESCGTSILHLLGSNPGSNPMHSINVFHDLFDQQRYY